MGSNEEILLKLLTIAVCIAIILQTNGEVMKGKTCSNCGAEIKDPKGNKESCPQCGERIRKEKRR